jgi:hypothetical protein
MFTLSKKGTKALVKNSKLVENDVLKKAIVTLHQEAAFGGYAELAYERYIFEKVITQLPGETTIGM